MIRFNCKKCEQRYKADEDLAGDEIECNKCGAPVHIPSVPPPAEKITLNIKKTAIESRKAAEVKMPTLTLPDSIRKKMQNQESLIRT